MFPHEGPFPPETVLAWEGRWEGNSLNTILKMTNKTEKGTKKINMN